MTAPRRPRGLEYLDGLRVLELGDGVSGAAATAVLRSLGARVDKVREPRSVLQRVEPLVPGGSGGPSSILSAILDRGKSITKAPSLGEADGYDLVVVDRFAPVSTFGHPRDPDAYSAFVRTTFSGAWVTISPFGLSGPRRYWTGGELVVGAAGGLVASDPDTGRPIKLGGRQALLGAGHVAALAGCHAIDLHRTSGVLAHLDVSAQDAAISIGPVLRLAHAGFRCTGASGSRRNGAPAGFYPCKDGRVRISAMENHQFEALMQAFDQPKWAAEFASATARIEHADRLDALVAAHIADWTMVECEETMQRAGVPATAMYGTGDILGWAQFNARNSFEQTPVGAHTATTVGVPFRSVAPAERATAPTGGRLGIHGLRVLEAGHVLAVPMSTSLLGAMGAHVTKLEDPRRLDVYRRRGPYIEGDPGSADDGTDLERSAYFATMNHSKRSVTLDLENDRDEVTALLRASDVVIENLGLRRARRLGLDAATVSAHYPHLLAISSSGYGQDGPWAGYRAYAYNLHAACGLCSQTRTPAEVPAEIDLAWGDLISAFALATVVAAWALSDRSPAAVAQRGIDFSMAELLAARFNDAIAAGSLGLPDDPEDGTSHLPPAAPNSFYATRDGGWVAISVESDAEWASLRAALEIGEDLRGVGGSAADRLAAQGRIDEVLTRIVAGWDGAAVAEMLQAAGVGAALLAEPHGLLADEHLATRDLFQPVVHPVWGEYRLLGLPWRAVDRDRDPLSAPPLLGSTPLAEVLPVSEPTS